MASDKRDMDTVNHPEHYRHGEFETLDYIFAVTENLPGDEAVCVSQILKYTSRYNKKKKPLEDIKKARFYADKLIEILQKKGVEL